MVIHACSCSIGGGGKLRQENDYKFVASLGYMTRPHLQRRRGGGQTIRKTEMGPEERYIEKEESFSNRH